MSLTKAQRDMIHLSSAQIDVMGQMMCTDNGQMKLIHKFKRSEAGLYWLCKSQERRNKTAAFIENYVYDWITIAVFIVSITIYSFCWQYSDDFLDYNEIDGDHGTNTFFAFGIIIWVCANVWIFLCILSLNQNAFLLLLRTFEFWIKVGYSLLASVLSFYIEYDPDVSYVRLNILQMTVRVLFRLFFLFLVIVMSSMDALPIQNRNKQIALCFVASGAITILYFTNAVEFYDSLMESNIKVTSYFSVPANTLKNSSYRLVALFFWKQTVLSFLRAAPKNTNIEKCILIQETPFIQWILDSEEGDDQTEPKQHESAVEMNQMMNQQET
eukprot:63069_1